MVFSSRVIPGNERAIGTVQDNLVRRGVHLMTDDDHLVHVSGHPARDELRRLYRLVKPRYAVPMHGEWRHLSAHAALAREAGARPILLEDGDVLSLAPDAAEVVDSAPVGRLVLDGNRLVPLGGGVMARAGGCCSMASSSAASRSTPPGGCAASHASARRDCSSDDPELDRSSSEFADALADLPAIAPPRRRGADRCGTRRAASRARAAAAEAPAGRRARAAACREMNWFTGCGALRPDLVDGAVRRAAVRHAPGRPMPTSRPAGVARRSIRSCCGRRWSPRSSPP